MRGAGAEATAPMGLRLRVRNRTDHDELVLPEQCAARVCAACPPSRDILYMLVYKRNARPALGHTGDDTPYRRGNAMQAIRQGQKR